MFQNLRLALDPASFEDLLLFFPGIQKGLDAVCKDAMGKVTGSAFRHSKERVIIAEVFLNKMPNLKEGGQKDLLALIKDAGNYKELKTRLQHWESSTAGGSSLWSFATSFFSSKETSKYLDEAINQCRNIKDQQFLATLLQRVSEKPLLEQFAQDVLTGAHQYFHWFVKQNLPRLYFQAHEVKQLAMNHQVEAEANDQDQKRRASARSEWCNKIKMGQPQADSGYVQYIARYLILLSMCTRPLDTVFIHHIEEMKQSVYHQTSSRSQNFFTCSAQPNS